jgi:hypothetical protein
MSPLRTLFVSALTAASLAGAASAADPSASLPAGWSHAQVNIGAHTFIFDRGRVTAVGASSLTLRERDGSVVTIQVAPSAVIRINGQAGSFSQIQPGFGAMTVGVDGRPARRVQATAPPAAPVLTTTTGRALSMGASSLTLRKADGTIVTVQVAANAVVRVNGQPGTLSQIQRGYRVTTVGISGAPVRRVQARAPLRRGGSGSTTP